jgi:hypothetical protein
MKLSILLLLVLIAASFGCSPRETATTIPTSPPPSSSDPTPVPSSSEQTTFPSSLELSSALLVDFNSGLDRLDSYQAQMEMTFAGIYGGAPMEFRNLVTKTVHKPASFEMLTLEDNSTGEEAGWEMSAALLEASYYQYGLGGPCLVMASSEMMDRDGMPDPSDWLPEVRGAQVAGTETINGTPAQRFTFNEKNIEEAAGFQASGEYWLADPGGWLVKYTLTLTGKEDAFGEGMSGSQSLTYNVRPDAAQSAKLPEACPARLADFPSLPDASSLTRLPTSLSYTTGQSAPQAKAFYEEAMPAAGWEIGTDPLDLPDGAVLYYQQEEAERVAVIRIWQAHGLTQVFAVESSLASQASEPIQQETGGVSNPNQRVSQALQLLSGDDQTPSAFDSYHLEVDTTTPSYNQGTGAVVIERQVLKADVQGEQVHLFYGGSPDRLSEGYVDGETGYKVENGKLQEDLFEVAMTWVLWQMDVVFPYSYAIAGTSFTGYEELDGRRVEVYSLDSRQAPAGVLEAIQGFMMVPISESQGTAWVDSQTGALVKLVLKYEAEFKNPNSGAVIGTGSGQVELVVSEVGRVEVRVEP